MTSAINRYYDPTTGQFISVDPMVIATGQAYSYTGGNPVNLADPSGMLTFPSWLPGGGVVTDAQNAVAGSFKATANFIVENASSISTATAVLAAVALSIPVVGEVASPLLGAVSVVTGAIATNEDLENHEYLQAALDSLGSLIGAGGLGADAASRLVMTTAQEAWDAGEAVVDLARTAANAEKISEALTKLSAAVGVLAAAYPKVEVKCPQG